jgi:hypothetical protein
MPALEWKTEHVHLSTERSSEISQACNDLTRQGWTPRFVVPVFPGHVHIIASRSIKSWHPKASLSRTPTPKIPPAPKLPAVQPPPRRKPL